jgi:hypothetical protein
VRSFEDPLRFDEYSEKKIDLERAIPRKHWFFGRDCNLVESLPLDWDLDSRRRGLRGTEEVIASTVMIRMMKMRMKVECLLLTRMLVEVLLNVEMSEQRVLQRLFPSVLDER